jgi:hypothetical protein
MRRFRLVCVSALVIALSVAMMCQAEEGRPRYCSPERPVPGETMGPVGIPFDLPIYPTIVKTEFHILPWVTFGKSSICLPYTSKQIQIPSLCVSMKPIPVWFPWLRPLDIECDKKGNTCSIP